MTNPTASSAPVDLLALFAEVEAEAPARAAAAAAERAAHEAACDAAIETCRAEVAAHAAMVRGYYTRRGAR